MLRIPQQANIASCSGFVVPWIPQQANIASCSGFVVPWIPRQANITCCSGYRNCKWIPQNESGIRKCKWSPQTVYGFRVLFITEVAYEQLKARTGYSNEKFEAKDLTIVSGIHQQNSC